jgi:hypothetical protein
MRVDRTGYTGYIDLALGPMMTSPAFAVVSPSGDSGDIPTRWPLLDESPASCRRRA